jgi:hypothetical protein
MSSYEQNPSIPDDLITRVLQKIRDYMRNGRALNWPEVARRVEPLLRNAPGGALDGNRLAKWVNDGVQKRRFPDWFIREHRAWQAARRGQEPIEEITEDVAEPARAALVELPPVAIVTAEIAGLPLEVVENEWVTLRSLFEPFGKRTSEQLARLREWANLRQFSLTARTLTGKSAENLTRESWAIHRDHVPQAIAELDPRGMPEEVKIGFVRFKRECAAALAAYFFAGKAENPRAQPSNLLDAVAKMLAGGVVEAKADAAAAKAHAEEVRRVAAEGIDRVEGRIEGVEGRVDELAKRATGPTAPPKPAGWKFSAEWSRAVGMPSQGRGKMTANRLISMVKGVQRGLAQEADMGGGMSALAIAPRLQDEIAPLARMFTSALDDWGWTVFQGELVLKHGLDKPNRSFEWVRDRVAMPRIIAHLRGDAPPAQTMMPFGRRAS